MTKLMITALMFCSALSLAAEPLSTAPKKKAAKTEVVSDAQKIDETVFGGSGSLGTTGLRSAGTAAPKGRAKLTTAPAPTK